MTKTKTAKPSRLMAEMIETADNLHRLGLMDGATHAKITLRDQNRAEAAVLAPLTGEDIRVLREQAHMSQAVFARKLHLTTGHLSKLERGTLQPTGPALVLLDVIRRKGLEAIL